MSRSYRYDADDGWEDGAENGGGRAGRRRARRRRGDAASAGGDGFEAAVRIMESRIAYVVDALVSEGTIEESEREDYLSLFKERICRAVPRYDAGRTNGDGRTCSPAHYYTIIADGLVQNIRDYVNFRRRRFRGQPITSDPDEAREDASFIHSGDARLSDGCRGVRDLWLRMDVETLWAMLDAEERLCLGMRLAGHTDVEVAEEIAARMGSPCDRHHVQKVVAVHLQRKARACGFHPSGEDS